MTIVIGSFEYNLLLTLTFLLLGVKLLLWIYLLRKIIENKKKRESFEFDFVFGIFVLVLSLFISRILYTYFDFVATRFDPSTYHLPQNVIYYRLAVVSSLIGLAILLFVIDKNVLKFKFKGIFTYVVIVAIVFELLYPVNTAEDFDFINIIETIAGILTVIIFPSIFFYVGIKIERLRKIAFIFAFGIIIYIIGAVLLAEFIIGPLEQSFGSTIRISIWILAIGLKITGLIMISYSCTKFY